MYIYIHTYVDIYIYIYHLFRSPLTISYSFEKSLSRTPVSANRLERSSTSISFTESSSCISRA